MPKESRVLILTPTGSDAESCAEVLSSSEIHNCTCRSQQELLQQMREGVGAILVAEEALQPTAQLLIEELRKQSRWSDLPLIVLAATGSYETNRIIQEFGRDGNFALLDRPLKRRNLITAVNTALRARKRQYEVRAMLEQRDNFLAMLGHELRNPLGPISNGLHVMGKCARSQELEKIRVMMERQTTHLTRIVDDLLDVSRVINGKIVLKKERIDLRRLLQTVLDDHRPQFEARHLSLHAELCPGGITVEADVTRLTQVISNLLVNAMKFTERGYVKVTLAVRESRALISVSDTGAGISPRMQERIFDIFSQVNETISRSRGGMGLGLALCRSLIELHDGKISVYSEGENRGSTFTLELPCVICEPPSEKERTSFVTQSKLRVVLIEDNVDAAESLQMLLQLNGHQVNVAHTGKAGIDLALDLKPDVVICDIGLPEGVSGFDVARALKPQSNSRLIALTGYGRERDQREAKDAGFTLHLTKPVDIEQLELALR